MQVAMHLSICALQLADSERRCKVVEAEYTSYREASRAQPESQLQAQISMLQLEKVWHTHTHRHNLL